MKQSSEKVNHLCRHLCPHPYQRLCRCGHGHGRHAAVMIDACRFTKTSGAISSMSSALRWVYGNDEAGIGKRPAVTRSAKRQALGPRRWTANGVRPTKAGDDRNSGPEKTTRMQGGKGTWWHYAPIALIAAGLALAYALGVMDAVSIENIYASRIALKHVVADHIVLSVAGAFLFYAIAIAFVFPAPVVLTVAAGFLFGWWLGGLIAIAGATVGGSILFLAARSAFGSVLRKRAGTKMALFAEGFRRDAFTYLLVLRLTPLLPVAVLNIGPAFFGITLRAFALATLIGIVPGAMVYAFLGSGLDRALRIAGKYENLLIGDLMTRDLTVALLGLTALSLLGVLLKHWLLRRQPTEGEATAGDRLELPPASPAESSAQGPAKGAGRR